jgi:hypothetical protein
MSSPWCPRLFNSCGDITRQRRDWRIEPQLALLPLASLKAQDAHGQNQNTHRKPFAMNKSDNRVQMNRFQFRLD